MYRTKLGCCFVFRVADLAVERMQVEVEELDVVGLEIEELDVNGIC